jgi:hypothetical protein
MDIFFCVLAILASLMTIYLLVGLFPGAQRRQQDCERRLKGGGESTIPRSRLWQVASALMVGAVAGQSFALAFHFNLSRLTGLSSSALSAMTFLLLPSLVILLGIRDRRHFESEYESGA